MSSLARTFSTSSLALIAGEKVKSPEVGAHRSKERGVPWSVRECMCVRVYLEEAWDWVKEVGAWLMRTVIIPPSRFSSFYLCVSFSLLLFLENAP